MSGPGPLHWIRSWHLILIGIGMNIVASLQTHIWIDRDLQELGGLMIELHKLDSRIDGLWQQHVELERKRELLVLVSHLEQPDDPSNSLLETLFQPLLKRLTVEDSAGENGPSNWFVRLEREQEWLRDQIDDLYLQRITLDQQRQPLERSINGQRNAALFLQLMGLILVLSKDLARPSPGH